MRFERMSRFRPLFSKQFQLTTLAIFLKGYRLRVPTMAQSCPRFTRAQSHHNGIYTHSVGSGGRN